MNSSRSVLVGHLPPSQRASATALTTPTTLPPTMVQPNTTNQKRIIIRRVHAQIVHRHGDRSPITALRDEAYWQTQLYVDHENVTAQRFVVLQDGTGRAHKANGRGPFGKLTTLGWQQMVDLGKLLWRAFLGGEVNASVLLQNTRQNTDNQDIATETIIYPYIGRPVPSHIQMISTSFERAIQSAQGVLVGLLGEDYWADHYETISGGTNNHQDDEAASKVTIDARHTVRLLPDPQPRETAEQIELEDVLAARPHLQTVEDELLPLAQRVTAALQPLLAADAREAVFGAKQQPRTPTLPVHASDESIEIEPLAWNQLAEITKCLACRGLLPNGENGSTAMSEQDHHDVVQHAAWRWFESFRHPRLAYLSMHQQVEHMVGACRRFADAYERGATTGPPLVLYSAHDSTLIGLLCALKLEQPVAWPEYGSFLLMELLQVAVVNNQDTIESETVGDNAAWYIRFSLNGQLLRNMWEEDEQPQEMIRLQRLMEKLEKEDAATRGLTKTAADYRYVSPQSD